MEFAIRQTFASVAEELRVPPGNNFSAPKNGSVRSLGEFQTQIHLDFAHTNKAAQGQSLMLFTSGNYSRSQLKGFRLDRFSTLTYVLCLENSSE